MQVLCWTVYVVWSVFYVHDIARAGSAAIIWWIGHGHIADESLKLMGDGMARQPTILLCMISITLIDVKYNRIEILPVNWHSLATIDNRPKVLRIRRTAGSVPCRALCTFPMKRPLPHTIFFFPKLTQSLILASF